jgi:hypothetical protein
VLYTAAVWYLWNLRKKLCFHGQCWEGITRVMASCAKLLWNCSLVNNSDDTAQLTVWPCTLEARSARPERLMWATPDDAEARLKQYGPNREFVCSVWSLVIGIVLMSV